MSRGGARQRAGRPKGTTGRRGAEGRPRHPQGKAAAALHAAGLSYAEIADVLRDEHDRPYFKSKQAVQQVVKRAATENE